MSSARHRLSRRSMCACSCARIASSSSGVQASSTDCATISFRRTSADDADDREIGGRRRQAGSARRASVIGPRVRQPSREQAPRLPGDDDTSAPRPPAVNSQRQDREHLQQHAGGLDGGSRCSNIRNAAATTAAARERRGRGQQSHRQERRRARPLGRVRVMRRASHGTKRRRGETRRREGRQREHREANSRTSRLVLHFGEPVVGRAPPARRASRGRGCRRRPRTSRGAAPARRRCRSGRRAAPHRPGRIRTPAASGAAGNRTPAPASSGAGRPSGGADRASSSASCTRFPGTPGSDRAPTRAPARAHSDSSTRHSRGPSTPGTAAPRSIKESHRDIWEV